jgi:hypothetical protein
MPRAGVIVAGALLVMEGIAFRVKPRHGKNMTHEDAERGEPGMVDALFTFGAPGSATPALENHRDNNKCFPGFRLWNMHKRAWGEQVDIVPPLAGVVGYKHPYMDSIELEVGKGKHTMHKCSEEMTEGPNGVGLISLHEPELYIEHTQGINKLLYDVSNVGLRKSYIKDEKEVARRVAEYGYRLVATAFHRGNGSITGGPQVSHLIQHPRTLACMVTFQGTQSVGDALSDIDIAKSEFCGLPQKVHKGFRDHLRRIIKTKVWQKNILNNIPKCSKLWVVGHSLGGAMAELFTACTAKAPGWGQVGYKDDYKYIRWTKGKAQQLPYIPV